MKSKLRTSAPAFALLASLASLHCASGLKLTQSEFQVGRRALLGAAIAAPASCAAEPLIVLTDEEMAARVARKQELLRAKAAGGTASTQRGLDGAIRSDINPDAGVNLRSRSMLENAKATLAKQEELKKRDKKQQRDDLCEMLGRGC